MSIRLKERREMDSAELRAILAPAKLDSMPMTRERWPYTVDH